FHRMIWAFVVPCRRHCQTTPDGVEVLPASYPREHQTKMARLTIRSVEAMKPKAVRQEIPDSFLPGLYLIQQPSGAKGWAVRYRHQGIPRKLTLGGYPALGLQDARKLGAKALRAVAEGRDPGREKVQARAAKADSADRIVEELLDRHIRRSNRPRTAQQTERRPWQPPPPAGP